MTSTAIAPVSMSPSWRRLSMILLIRSASLTSPLGEALAVLGQRIAEQALRRQAQRRDRRLQLVHEVGDELLAHRRQVPQLGDVGEEQERLACAAARDEPGQHGAAVVDEVGLGLQPRRAARPRAAATRASPRPGCRAAAPCRSRRTSRAASLAPTTRLVGVEQQRHDRAPARAARRKGRAVDGARSPRPRSRRADPRSRPEYRCSRMPDGAAT